MTGPEPDATARGWGWLAHLRAGGTTPWSEWREAAPAAGATLPGVLQLELLRRVNLVGRPPEPVTDRVLRAIPVGRALVERPLAGLATGYGPPGVDPAGLGDHALLGVAAAALAEGLAAEPTVAEAPLRLPRPWHPAYRLVGDPWLVEQVREGLVQRGRVPGGRRPRHLVVGTDVATMLTHAWTRIVAERPAAPWLAWLESWAHREAVPPRIDLVRASRRAARLVGPERVWIVLDTAQVGRLLRVRRLPPFVDPPAADAVEVVRRTGQPLALLLPPELRRVRLRQLTLRLVGRPGPPLAVPDALDGWVREQAARMAADLRADGYPGSGEAASLTRRALPGAAPTDRGALELAVRLLATKEVG